MRNYQYKLDVHSNFVTVVIFSKKDYMGDEIIQNHSSKSFDGGFFQFFKNYPSEKQLVQAKKWGQKQIIIMNHNQ